MWQRRVALALCILGLWALGCRSKTPTQPTPAPPPSLSCAANLTVSGVVGAAQHVSFQPPIVSGGAPPVTAACTPAPGAAFPIGATMVTCTARDARGREATCTFSVMLDALRLQVHRFVAFGDSVTAGEDGRRLQLRPGFVDPARSYPALLRTLLSTDFPGQDLTVVNAGFGGNKAADDVGRLPEVLEREQPEVLLILHGYNDLLNGGVRASDGVAQALRAQIRLARARGVIYVLVSTLTPSRRWTPAPNIANREIDPAAIAQTNSRITALAPAEGAILVNSHDAFRGREAELIGDDGLHLTFAGNQLLAETFHAAVRRITDQQSPPGIARH